MNYKHGHYSKKNHIRPDSRIGTISEITKEHLIIAERYLGDVKVDSEGNKIDLIYAHEIVKIIYQAGRFSYPAIHAKAVTYVNNRERYENIERLSRSLT